MITSLPTKRISAISQRKTLIRVLPTRWRRKPAGIKILWFIKSLWFTVTITLCIGLGIDSAPIELAQCRFAGLAISNARILIYFFSNKIYGSNFIKQHPETVMAWNYQNADCSLRKKFIVSFRPIIIFGTLSFPMINLPMSKWANGVARWRNGQSVGLATTQKVAGSNLDRSAVR